MKNIVIFALIFVTVNSTFLRNLAAVTEITFKTPCIKKATPVTGSIEMSLKVDTQITNTGSYAVELTAGTGKDITGITCTKDSTDTSGKTISCTAKALSDTDKVGTYKLKTITETPTGENQTAVTYDITNIKGSFIYAEEVSLGKSQTEKQTVDAKDNSNKSFNIVFAEGTTEAPAIFASEKATTPLSGCTFKSEDATATCTPTADEMENGKEYEIYYNKGCDKTKTGVTVKFNNNSMFITVSKIALVALALLF